MKVFKPTRWWSIRVFQAPCAMFQSEPLFPNSLPQIENCTIVNAGRRLSQSCSCSMRLLRAYKGKTKPLASVTIKQKLLMERTGLSKNIITSAARELEAKRFIKLAEQRKKYGEFAGNRVSLCDPVNGRPVRDQARWNFLYANDAAYFNIPVSTLREQTADWSIAKLSGSALTVYVALSWLANKKGSNTIEPKPSTEGSMQPD